MKRIFFFICLAFVVNPIAKAQSPTVYDPTPVWQSITPNNAGFTKYLESPVGHYTGIPSISIPVYNLKIGDFSLPITLSYNAGGIKVKELETWVGLGWNLNVGGCITRIVKGRVDDYASGNGVAATSFFQIGMLEGRTNHGRIKIMDENGTSGLSMLSTREKESIFYGDVFDLATPVTPLADATIDEYSYNFLGYSGKFAYCLESDKVVKSSDDLLIEKSSNNKGFTITDSKGNKYYFETILKSPLLNGVEFYANSFILSKITLYKPRKTIYFLYDYTVSEVPLFTDYPVSYLMEGVYQYIAEADGVSASNTFFHGYPVLQEDSHINHLQAQEVTMIDAPNEQIAEDVVLKYIMVDDIVVEFISETESLNYAVEQNRKVNKLNRIVVGESTDTIHMTTFNYDYFLTNNGTKKVKLDNINVNGKQFGFDYIEQYNGVCLPSYTSKGIDYWGFYNGVETNENLNIKLKSDLKPDEKIYQHTYAIANRVPNEDYAKLGTLKRIIYPTGGYSIYDYEGNTYSGLFYSNQSITSDKLDFLDYDNEGSGNFKIGGGLRIKSIKKYDKDHNKVLHKNYEYHDSGNTSYGILEAPFTNYKTRLQFVKDHFYKHYAGYLWEYRAWCWFLYLDVYNNLINPNTGNNPTSIGYKCVIEKDNISNGYTKYYFTTSEDYPDMYKMEPYRKYDNGYGTIMPDYFLTHHMTVDNSSRRGLLKKKEIYDKNDNLIKEESNNYIFRDTKSGQFQRAYFPADPINFGMTVSIQNFRPSYPLLDSKTTVDYFSGGNISRTKDYTYNANYPFIATDELTENNNTYKTEYYYVDSNPSLSGLQNDNLISEPYKVIKKINNAESYFVEKGYVLINGMYVPDLISEKINGNQLPQTIIDYDDDGNVKKIEKKDGTFEYYVWGYSKMYPIAKIVSHLDIPFDISVTESSLSRDYDKLSIDSDISYLKALLSTYISSNNYQVFLYTYKPLTGITSETDQNQKTIYYYYDRYGRLLQIKNHYDEIIKEYEYNYSTEH